MMAMAYDIGDHQQHLLMHHLAQQVGHPELQIRKRGSRGKGRGAGNTQGALLRGDTDSVASTASSIGGGVGGGEYGNQAATMTAAPGGGVASIGDSGN